MCGISFCSDSPWRDRTVSAYLRPPLAVAAFSSARRLFISAYAGCTAAGFTLVRSNFPSARFPNLLSFHPGPWSCWARMRSLAAAVRSALLMVAPLSASGVKCFGARSRACCVPAGIVGSRMGLAPNAFPTMLFMGASVRAFTTPKTRFVRSGPAGRPFCGLTLGAFQYAIAAMQNELYSRIHSRGKAALTVMGSEGIVRVLYTIRFVRRWETVCTRAWVSNLILNKQPVQSLPMLTDGILDVPARRQLAISTKSAHRSNATQCCISSSQDTPITVTK